MPRLGASVPARTTGGFMAALAVLLTTLWTAIVVSALASATPIDPIAHLLWTLPRQNSLSRLSRTSGST